MYRPHDLLWLADAADLVVETSRPAWATAPWLAVAPMVVRRAVPTASALIPVGLRGATRRERCAAQVPGSSVDRRATPEGVACHWTRRTYRHRPLLPCLQALDALAPVLDDQPLAWGVTGSVGFTLASGFDVLRADSDLDLLLRAPYASGAGALRRIALALQQQPARIDAQVETPWGAFALGEWSRTGGPVLLKTARGPVLVEDPWHMAESTLTV